MMIAQIRVATRGTAVIPTTRVWGPNGIAQGLSQ